MITIYDWFGYEMSIKERYRMIKSAGFDGVLMWWSEFLDRNDYRSGPEIARREGLFIENIHTPFQYDNFLFLDNLDGESAVNCYLQCIEDCAEFEIPTMVVHMPNDKNPLNNLGLNRVNKIASKAEKLNINVALENLNNIKNLTQILEKINSSKIGYCYDCCHHNNYNPDDDLLTMYGSRLMALHLHDNAGSRSMHNLPFDGNIDWKKTMKKITQTNYSGATALEPMNWDYTDYTAEEFLRKAFHSAKKLEILRRL